MPTSAGQILIVDDTPGNIKLIAAMLKDAGYGISFANSGRQALDILKRSLPDLVLLDIVMPDMDGFETCRRIKSDPDIAAVPVIFLSTLTDTAQVVKGLDAGAVDYLGKPVQKALLLARVRTHLTIQSFQRGLEARVRRRTRALRRALQQIDDILVSMPSVVISLDGNGRVSHWNPRAEARTGISRDLAAGRPLEELFHHPVVSADRIRTVLDTGTTYRESRVHDRSSGSGPDSRYEDITIYALSGGSGVVIYMEDVTDQVRLEEMMIQSEKMMSLGGMAAGIAHEINNPLAGMMQTAELLNRILVDDLEPDNRLSGESGIWDTDEISAFMASKEIPRLLSNIRDSGHKASRIVSNMLSFARRSDTAMDVCRIPGLLDETLELVRSTHHTEGMYHSGNICFVKDYADELPEINCDPAKIQQVFLNILQNGIYALNRFREDVDPSFEPVLHISAAMAGPGREIEIIFRDNGPGVDKALQKKIFDPFFTTKPPGVGTGLGLSISYFIITQAHNGTLRVESSPGRGTAFIIGLPVCRTGDPGQHHPPGQDTPS